MELQSRFSRGSRPGDRRVACRRGERRKARQQPVDRERASGDECWRPGSRCSVEQEHEKKRYRSCPQRWFVDCDHAGRDSDKADYDGGNHSYHSPAPPNAGEEHCEAKIVQIVQIQQEALHPVYRSPVALLGDIQKRSRRFRGDCIRIGRIHGSNVGFLGVSNCPVKQLPALTRRFVLPRSVV